MSEKTTVEKSLNELVLDEGELRLEKNRLVAEKNALTQQLVELNASCKIVLPKDKFHKIQRQRAELVTMLMEKEREIASVNNRRSELQTFIDVRKNQAGQMNRSDIRYLVSLRDKYHEFSMTSGNHQKAREIAWAVSQELRGLLKTYFDKGVA